VQDRLAGTVKAPDGSPVSGPTVRWIGRRHGRRQDRRWATSWSPEQISARLRVDFPDDESMRISHEAIYQALYVQGRGALRRELVACLRTGRALRVPRERTRGRGRKFITADVMISERPAEVEDRAVPGHWEGDLILGTNRSAIGTLVERTTRFTLLLHLPPMPGHGIAPQTKNGPPLAGHGAEAVRDAIAVSIATLPDLLRKSLTWDQGSEMAQHVQLRTDIGLAIYFCDPRSPWQRGTNENTNGLLRQYFPKGTDLSRHSPHELEAVAAALNGRPRKTLHWRTPAEALNDHVLLTSTSRCCNDSLNLGITRPWPSATGYARPGSWDRWDASRQASTTPSSNPSGRPCNAISSTGTRGHPARNSPRRSSNGSKAGTTPTTSHQHRQHVPARLRNTSHCRRCRGMITTPKPSGKPVQAPKGQ
jgi:IS30 family transposase